MPIGSLFTYVGNEKKSESVPAAGCNRGLFVQDCPSNLRRQEIVHSAISEKVFSDPLAVADAALAGRSKANVPELFKSVPLDIFALATCLDGSEFQNIQSYFPKMPDEDFQKLWVGSSGEPLLRQSVAFVKSVVRQFEAHADKRISEARILDYGVGWGRLIRLFNKFVHEDQLFGVDAWATVLETSEQLGVRGTLAQVDSYPRSLPFNHRFDLIFAFSIFTHLSARCAEFVSKACANALSDDGVMVITIRPISAFDQNQFANVIAEYHEKGIGFSPADTLEPVDGDISYGDTAISPDYIRDYWPWLKIVDIEYNMIDPQQILVVMQRA